MICDAEFLGTFDRCEDVVLPFDEGEIDVFNFVTEWKCKRTFPNLGRFALGQYSFNSGGTEYWFRVEPDVEDTEVDTEENEEQS